jgi:hypothetical protein
MMILPWWWLSEKMLTPNPANRLHYQHAPHRSLRIKVSSTSAQQSGSNAETHPGFIPIAGAHAWPPLCLDNQRGSICIDLAEHAPHSDAASFRCDRNVCARRRPPANAESCWASWCCLLENGAEMQKAVAGTTSCPGRSPCRALYA